jgi:hypothetical protein
MKNIIRFLSVAVFTMAITVSPLYAADDHAHGHDSHQQGGSSMGMDHEMNTSGMSNMFLVKKKIDDYDVSFHVMKAQPGKEMGGSHDFMIKVEKDGKTLTNVLMNTKVIFPDGKSASKKTMVMGDWLMAGYDLGNKGKHQLMILFKTADGKKHKGGVYYPAK